MIGLAVLLGGGSILLLAAGGSVAFTHFGWSEQNLLLWNAFLSILFFVQHSGMVRKPFRAWLAQSVPEEYHGALYSIASGVVLTFVVVCWQRSGVMLWEAEGVARVVLLCCSLFAIGLFVWGALSIRSFDILGIAPLRARLRGRVFAYGPFEVRGPYRWMRHPLYSGVLLMLWANPIVTSDRLLFNILWSLWMIGATYLEERDLVREFGTQYTEYQRHVPMLVPFRRPWP
jgi:protein-S-isoprenylcysteine O-methyltransferase Ste14